mmetsp:Transcript_2501/g.3679  ORF Transcript_2501/g.3679 Transcript_2501/m.3679 type:complete len:144 (+) Transcript_2501:52-483(+)
MLKYLFLMTFLLFSQTTSAFHLRTSVKISRSRVFSASNILKATKLEVDAVKKAELVSKISAKSGLNKTQVDAVISAFIETVTESVSDGKKISLQGLGTFEPRLRAARQGKNFHTGEIVEIPSSMSPAFTASKSFKDMVKESKK